MTVELLSVSDFDHADGPANAPATLVVYGDYECPHTRAVHLVLRRVHPRLAGTLRFVYRHFPLRSVHPHAQHAAEIAELANAAGDFWSMHNHLFHHQETLDDADLVRYANEFGIDESRASDALRSHPHAERVEVDVRSGLALGVRGTPTLFINGVRYQGERDAHALETALRDASAHSSPA